MHVAQKRHELVSDLTVASQAIKSAGAGTAEWKETYTLNEFAPKSSSILEVTVYNHNTLRPDGTLGKSLL